MVERLRPALERLRPKPRHCSTDNYEELTHIINTRPDTVLPRIDALDDVVACHYRATACTVGQDRMAAQLMPSLVAAGYKYYSVDRFQLFKFHVAHGKVCPHG